MRDLGPAIGLAIAIAAPGCTIPATKYIEDYSPAPSRLKAILSANVGFCRISDSTDKDYLKGTCSPGWKYSEVVQAITKAHLRAIQAARVFADVEELTALPEVRTSIPSRSLDLIISGEMLRFEQVVNHEPWGFISPMSLGVFINLPAFPIRYSAVCEARFMCFKADTWETLDTFIIRSEQKPRVIWGSWTYSTPDNNKLFCRDLVIDVAQQVVSHLEQQCVRGGKIATAWGLPSAQAQTPHVAVFPRARERAELANSIRSTHILIIGIGSYADPNIPKLNYTNADARAVFDFFKNADASPAKARDVHFLGNAPNEDGLAADRRGIMLAIDKYLVKKAVHKDDMAVLYFSGHGDVGRHPTKGTEYYLIPQDAVKDSLYATAIELGEFQRMWNAIPASTKILIADACNSGGFSGVRGSGGVTGVESVQGQAKAVFSACKSDEKSIECDSLGHGLFTHVLLKGLKGRADRNGDDRVTLAELKQWLDRQVPLQARKVGGKQTPITSLVDAWGDVYLTR